jgi:predicted acetylornithine/succinylornithine family transaminase
MDEHVMSTYRRTEEVLVGGRGAQVWDEKGRVWLDFLGGIAVSALGHSHPRLVEALRDQAGRLIHVSNLFRHPYTEDVAARLAKLSGLDAVFFTNSGTEANEAALKLARKHHVAAGAPERRGFVALEGSFHGRTLGSLSVTHTAKYREPFEPLIPGVTFVAPDDETRLAEVLRRERPAALIVEPIQGESGVRDLSFSFLRRARGLCDETGTVLIHDEVQSGAGRTGDFLAADAAGVKPDVVTLAKPIGGGLPMGVMIVNRALSGTFQPGDHGSTFAGGPFVLRAALVFLQELDEAGLMDNVRARGAQLATGLADLKRDFPVITGLSGRGLIRGVKLAHGAEQLVRDLHAGGLIANRTGGDVLRLLPPYVITADELARGLDILRDQLKGLPERA